MAYRGELVTTIVTTIAERMVLPERIELSTSPLPKDFPYWNHWLFSAVCHNLCCIRSYFVHHLFRRIVLFALGALRRFPISSASAASLRKSGTNFAYVLAVILGSECPSIAAIRSMLTPSSAIRQAAECRKTCAVTQGNPQRFPALARPFLTDATDLVFHSMI
jgi:hypothetical protein